MNLEEKISKLKDHIQALFDERSLFLGEMAKIQLQLDENQAALNSAGRECDSLVAARSIVTEPKKSRIVQEDEELIKKRQLVFAAMKSMPGIWVKPFGIAAVTDLDVNEVCDILRRASTLPGFPLEHNGERGRGSMYCWNEKK